jgi:hypothetical protein
MTYTIGKGTSGAPQAAETITLPSYPSASNPVIAGTSDIPTTYTSGGAGSTLTVSISQANFDSAPASTYTYGSDTPDFFTTLEVSASVTFGNGSDTLLIPVTITSPCVTAGTTYQVYEYDKTLATKLYTETDTASGTTVTGHIEVSVNPFPSGMDVDVVVSH